MVAAQNIVQTLGTDKSTKGKKGRQHITLTVVAALSMIESLNEEIEIKLYSH
jgi:hypothetical protein